MQDRGWAVLAAAVLVSLAIPVGAQQQEESRHHPAAAGDRSGMTGVAWSAVPRTVAPEANPDSRFKLAPNRLVPNTTTVYMSGNTAYQYAGNQARMTVDQVNNDSTTNTTGTLRLTLWFSADAFPAAGYDSADYTLGQLAPSHYYHSIDSGFVPFAAPPTGCYHVALLLEEFTAGQWYYDDYVAYSTVQSINGGCAPASPTINSFTASPSSVAAGSSSVLSWTTSNATSVSIDHGIGAVGTNSSTTVTPSSTTTYTLTASNGSTQVTRAVTVTVTSSPCSGATTLCLNNNRFAISATWHTSDGQSGQGQGVQLTSDTGYFTFFSASNVEVVIKVLNACGLNSKYWVFAGGLTDVNVVLTVRDTVTGSTRTYTNPLGTAFQPIQDTAAFTCSSSGSSLTAPFEAQNPSGTYAVGPMPAHIAPAAACSQDATTMCLSGNRFAVTATWRTGDGQSGSGQAVPLTADTGYFTFFSASNVEVVVKVLNACSLNSKYWVFAGGLTNVNVVLTVRDTITGTVRTYTNPLNTAFQPIQDTAAFATCGASGPTYTLSTSTAGTGSGVVSPSGGSYASGAVVSLTATPNTGSTFGGWSGACTGTTPTCTLTMNADKSVTATFNGTGTNSGGTFFSAGSSTVVASQTIGPSGGTITVTGSGTPIDGAKIIFPAGALATSSPVKISFNRGTLSPISGTFSGAALAVDVTGLSTFSQPLSITVPYTGGNSAVPVPYFADANGKLRPAQIISIDRQAGTFTFQVFHASLFTWLFGSTAPSTNVVSTSYLPINDGFQIVNYGSTFNREGECLGMTSFSLWYLINQKATLGKFYPKYMASVGTDSDNHSILGQNVIATRAFTSITQKWTSYLPEVSRQQTLTPGERYASIQNIIANTGAPVLIYLYHSDGSAGAHAVLAYEVATATHSIAIYDPNLPGTVQHIQYSTSSSAFSPYCNSACYDGIVYNGDGSLSVTEPYTNILADAQQNFNNSGGATIDINSHTNGQVLSSRLITLSGVVHSSQLLVTKLTVVIGSTEYSSSVPVGGAFSIQVALSDGVNHLKFRTEGTASSGALVTTSNNYDIKDFTLKALVPGSVILMTLTWDKNDTDVDTYVIDPTGDYSSYYHNTTADGGDLDQDITTGYGPEHWTLLNTDIVRYNQPYKFRVHYYSDHGNGPTNYTVTIELYNGTSRQRTYTYTGALTVSNDFNTGPNDTGPDWAEIATVILTQGAGNETPPTAQATVGGGVTITVPVPALQDRRKLKK